MAKKKSPSKGKNTKIKAVKTARITKKKDIKQEFIHESALELKPLLEKPTTAYDDLFEKKLSEQYKVFRDVKEHHMQTRKFLRILLILFVVILIAVLLLSFSTI